MCFAFDYDHPVCIDDKGLKAITRVMTDNQSQPLERLYRLKLEWECIFTDTAADCLIQFISRTTTLQYLRIGWCTFSAHGLLELARTIHNKSILLEKSLEDLNCTVNGDDDAKKFARVIVEYPQVEGEYKYDIVITHISEVGAVVLAEVLCHNSSLKMLDLSNNSIRDAGALALAQALHHNAILKMLFLSNNGISDNGAVALAQALHHNSTLKRLNLSNNSTSSDVGAVAIAQALHHNRSLEWLNLSNNSISNVGAVALAQALHRNYTLKRLALSYNSISDTGAVASGSPSQLYIP